MKLSFSDIKSRIAEKPKIIRPSIPQYPAFSASKLDISPYQLSEELWVIPDYITPDLESSLLNNALASTIFIPLRGRNVQMYGGIVSASGLSEPSALPQWLEIFAKRLFDEHIFPLKPNHVLVNEYLPGDGIMPHTDGPAYYPIVSTLSLGSASLLHFWNQRVPDFCLNLPQRSLVIFIGELYYERLHSIEMVPIDWILQDKCGTFGVTSSKILNKMIGKVPEDWVETDLPEPLACPICAEFFSKGKANYRDTRVSLTIRYVPIIG